MSAASPASDRRADAGKRDSIAWAAEDGFRSSSTASRCIAARFPPTASTPSQVRLPWRTRGRRRDCRHHRQRRPRSSCAGCGRRARRFSARIRSRTACAPRSTSTRSRLIADFPDIPSIQPMQEAITRQGATSQGLDAPFDPEHLRTTRPEFTSPTAPRRRGGGDAGRVSGRRLQRRNRRRAEI